MHSAVQTAVVTIYLITNHCLLGKWSTTVVVTCPFPLWGSISLGMFNVLNEEVGYKRAAPRAEAMFKMHMAYMAE